MIVTIDPYRIELARRLGLLRNQFDLSQRDFQEPLNLGQNVIYRAEKDLSMSVEALLALALYYVQQCDINPDWLFNPDNTDIPQLNTQAVRNRRKVQIFDKMVEEMRVAELVEQA
ncbi:helix-turn-helix transcriptional regulator [Fibrella sp. HMF5335]|uniref:Helix-turn-helix transcriptional regulator n=1 Tax=Fibrella rubiginis TaxID=2817060 RepID=A0A939GGN6_9BACT|nr:helix-turn-helix domain-containing protein [Fibrella rubiginis]MBO0936426.1 helix-turn-helix transcriptional regulator [Fibrella rubiginis]